MAAPSSVLRALAAVGRNRRLLAVQAAYVTFNLGEWATWIAILVYAYRVGGAAATGVGCFRSAYPRDDSCSFGIVSWRSPSAREIAAARVPLPSVGSRAHGISAVVGVAGCTRIRAGCCNGFQRHSHAADPGRAASISGGNARGTDRRERGGRYGSELVHDCRGLQSRPYSWG